MNLHELSLIAYWTPKNRLIELKNKITSFFPIPDLEYYCINRINKSSGALAEFSIFSYEIFHYFY